MEKFCEAEFYCDVAVCGGGVAGAITAIASALNGAETVLIEKELFLGGDNYYWQDTPMMALFEYYRDGNDANNEYAVKEAGKAAGRLLYQMLYNDKREFLTWVDYTRMYRWTGNEDNG